MNSLGIATASGLALALLMVFESVWRILLSGRTTRPAQTPATGEGGDPQDRT